MTLRRRPVCAAFINQGPEKFLPALEAISDTVELPLILGGPNVGPFSGALSLSTENVECSSFSEMVNLVWKEKHSDIVAIWDEIDFPPEPLNAALEAASKDPRVGTLSFLSNASRFLPFPDVFGDPEANYDPTFVTTRLRELAPVPRCSPMPAATGNAVLLLSGALGAVWPLVEPPWGSPEACISEFCLRARQKGFVDLVDGSTYCSVPAGGNIGKISAPRTSPDDLDWLRGLHPVAAPCLDIERDSEDSPFNLELQSARTKIHGLNVLIDGTCLGPHQMGTQVNTLELIGALARRDDVREVCVLLNAPIPGYAEPFFSNLKVRAGYSADRDPSPLGRFDVGHRPFQPDSNFRYSDWAACCRRVVVSLLDLIAYRIGAYHRSESDWLDYRLNLEEGLNQADGVVVISDDVRRQSDQERIPVDPTRICVVELGTDHLTGSEQARLPQALEDQGFVAEGFILILGADYSHKNRDLTLRTHSDLLERGCELSLVMAGAVVPFGSSRPSESEAMHEGVFVLPDVTDEGRNWLLRHASIVLYPTGAEGFGLLPFEAARFGTPTVFVGFGPLNSLAASLPVVAVDWNPSSLADAVQALLADPALAGKQVETTLAAAADLTWAKTAGLSTDFYRSLLARPPARTPARLSAQHI